MCGEGLGSTDSTVGRPLAEIFYSVVISLESANNNIKHKLLNADDVCVSVCDVGNHDCDVTTVTLTVIDAILLSSECSEEIAVPWGDWME